MVSDQPTREADQNRRQGRQPRSLRHLPVSRSRRATADVPADPVTHCAIAGARTSVRGPGIKCNGQRRLRCGLMKANQRVPAPRGRRTHSFGSTWRRSRGKLLLWMFLQPDNSVRRCRNWKMPVETAFTGLHIRGRTYCPGATTALISGKCRLRAASGACRSPQFQKQRWCRRQASISKIPANLASRSVLHQLQHWRWV